MDGVDLDLMVDLRGPESVPITGVPAAKRTSKIGKFAEAKKGEDEEG